MAKVIGLGGIFLKFKDPAKMRTWYKEVLGMETNEYGVLFAFNHTQAANPAFLQLGTFEENTAYFGAAAQQAMLNFRVDDLETLKNNIVDKGTTLVNEIESYSYGKFLHIKDPEGNRIELWEPVDKEFEGGTYMKMN